MPQEESQDTTYNITEFPSRQIEKIFVEQIDDNRMLAKENQELRAKIAELEEQLDDEQSRSTQLYTRYQFLIQWTRSLFANKTIPESTKLVLWQYYYTFSQMRDNPVNEEMRISVEDTAAAVGLSTSTIRKATDKAEMFEVLQRRYEPVAGPEGHYTLMHITLDPVIITPESIQMEKLQGGKRIPLCPKCGSNDVDRYTVQYCRSCDKNAWFGQTGLRMDADIKKAQNAENAIKDESVKSSLLFTAIASSDLSEQLATEQPEQLATEQPEQLAAQYIYIESSAASCEWKDQICRFCGPIKQWIWDGQDRVCPHCYSPRE